MVSATFEHIVAILVVGAIFVATIVVLPAQNYVNMQAVDQQQLRNTALSVFSTILLDSGDPFNWGSMDPFYLNDFRVTKFGLASSLSPEMYVLDPDKVQRLALNNPLNYLEYEKVRELLKLENYGFSLRIIPPFNVTNVDGTPIIDHSPITVVGTNLTYALRVTYLDGIPIPNVAIFARVVYARGTTFAINNFQSTSTDAVGLCIKSLTLNFEPDYVVVVLRAVVAGMGHLVVTFGTDRQNDPAEINFVDDTIKLTMPDNYTEAARWVNNIIPVMSTEDMEFLYNGTRSNDDKLNYGSQTIWSKTFNGLSDRDPVIFIFIFWTVDKKGGRQEILVAGPYQNLLGHTVFEFGEQPKNIRSSVRLQRSVVISGMTYTAELIFWKEPS